MKFDWFVPTFGPAVLKGIKKIKIWKFSKNGM